MEFKLLFYFNVIPNFSLVLLQLLLIFLRRQVKRLERGCKFRGGAVFTVSSSESMGSDSPFFALFVFVFKLHLHKNLN